MSAPVRVVADSTELCVRCGQEPLFPGLAPADPVYCAVCTGENRRRAIARLKRLQAAKRAAAVNGPRAGR